MSAISSCHPTDFGSSRPASTMRAAAQLGCSPCTSSLEVACCRRLRASTSVDTLSACTNPLRVSQSRAYGRPARQALKVSAGLHPAQRSFGQFISDTQGRLQQRIDVTTSRALENGAVRAVVDALTELRRSLQPAVDVWHVLQRWYAVQYSNFIAFTEDETKRKWKWQRRTEAQQQFWRSVKAYITVFALTVGYEALAPVSVFWAILLPSHAAWVLYDRWYVSPVFLGMLALMPLKFVPWAPWAWF